jgi:hypothetical protein
VVGLILISVIEEIFGDKMRSIQVNLLSPTKYGRLYYQHSPEIEPFVLFVQNDLKYKRTFSINIDSAIILDLNKNQIIQAVEFVIHKKVWKIDPKLVPPHPEIEADLQVTNLSSRNEAIETPVRSFTDEKYQYVFFDWGTNDNDKKWVYLSEQCYALIANNSLIGFFVYINSSDEK